MKRILIYTFNEVDINDFINYGYLKGHGYIDVLENLEIVNVKKYREIRNDIIERSYSNHFTRYLIINKFGFTRAQSRADTFTRHYLVVNKFDFSQTLIDISCEDKYFKNRIDEHMLIHCDFLKHCSLR